MWWQELIYLSFAWCLYRVAILVVRCVLPDVIEYWQWMAMSLLIVVYYRIRLPHWHWFTNLCVWQWYRDVWFPISYVNYQAPPDDPCEDDDPCRDNPCGDDDDDPCVANKGPIYMYAMVPHGLCSCASVFGVILNPAMFGNVHCLVASQLFYIPFIRNLAQICGLGHASAKNIRYQLGRGKSIMLVPEGMRAFMHLDERQEGMMKVLRKHRGFCHVMLSSSSAARIHVVPVYTPGEWNTYSVTLLWPALQSWMISNIWWAGPISILGWWGTWFPKRVPLVMHFGDPIPCAEPDGTLKTPDALHKEFCDVVQRMANEITDD